MANNPLSRFIESRFVQPAVEKAISTTLPLAISTGTTKDIPLTKAIGQVPQVDPTILYSLYKHNADISGSVHKWASKSTNGGYRLSLVDPTEELTPDLQARMLEIDRRLAKINPQESFRDILYWTAMQLPIIGRAFWYVSRNADGSPLEIWPMHPAITRVVATSHGEILGYVMRLPGQEAITFTPEEVIYFKLPNPINSVSGEGRVELLIEEAGIDLLALRSNKSIFQNGQSYSAVIMLDEKATPKEARELTDQIKQAHTGAENQHKLVAVSKARDFKPMTMTMRDMEFVGMRHLSTEKVTTAMGVPEFLLGNHNTGDYQSGKFLVREFHADVVQMVQGLLEARITEHLVQTIDNRFQLSLIPPDSSDPDDLRNDLMEAERQQILTKDEVRQDAFGKDPLPTETDGSPDDQPAEEPDDVDEPDADDTTKATKSIRKATLDDDYDTLAQERSDEIEALAEPMVEPLVAYFETQEADLLAQLSTDLTLDLLNSFLTTNSEALNTTLFLLMGSLVRPTLSAGVAAAQLQVDITLTAGETNPIIQDYGPQQLADRVKGINQTTRNQLSATLLEGINANESLDQLQQRIEAVFAEAKGYRARLIANNEVINAYAYANHRTLEVLYQQGVITHRMWWTAEDDRVRPAHQDLHGKIVRFEEKFPGDIEPGEEVNCRCVEMGLTAEQAAERGWTEEVSS